MYVWDAIGMMQRAVIYLAATVGYGAATDTLDSLSLDLADPGWRHRELCMCKNCLKGIKDGMERTTRTRA